jgi:hypothetical protein
VVAIQDMLEKLRPNLAEDTFWQEQNWILISMPNIPPASS